MTGPSYETLVFGIISIIVVLFVLWLPVFIFNRKEEEND